MKLLQLKNGEIIDSEEVKSLIINGEKKDYNKKLLLNTLKSLIDIGIVLYDGRIIKDIEIKEFYLIACD